MPSLQRSAARVIGISAVGRLVVGADHLNRPSGLHIVKSEVDCAAAIVTRPLCRIGDEHFLVFWRCVPKDLRHIPRSIGIMYQQAVARAFNF